MAGLTRMAGTILKYLRDEIGTEVCMVDKSLMVKMNDEILPKQKLDKQRITRITQLGWEICLKWDLRKAEDAKLREQASNRERWKKITTVAAQ